MAVKALLVKEGSMRFGFWPGSSTLWPDLLDLCQHAEATGWDGIWYADHFFQSGPDRNTQPYNECWTVNAALAVAVPRVRIGQLVTGNTYRFPALVAKMAATADHISGGRLVLGLGAAWMEAEHHERDHDVRGAAAFR